MLAEMNEDRYNFSNSHKGSGFGFVSPGMFVWIATIATTPNTLVTPLMILAGCIMLLHQFLILMCWRHISCEGKSTKFAAVYVGASGWKCSNERVG